MKLDDADRKILQHRSRTADAISRACGNALEVIDALSAQSEAVRPMPDEVRDMLEALRSYKQADEAGAMVLVSRQAVDEAVELISGRYAPLESK